MILVINTANLRHHTDSIGEGPGFFPYLDGVDVTFTLAWISFFMIAFIFT